MRITYGIAVSMIALATTSCGSRSTPGGNFPTLPILGAIAGGAVGASLGDDSTPDDDSTIGMSTAVGAAAGLALGTVAQIGQNKKQERIFTTGYDKGRSDAIKTLYWAQRNAEREEDNDTPVEYRYYEVPVPSYVTSDGVIVDSHRRVIEVVE